MHLELINDLQSKEDNYLQKIKKLESEKAAKSPTKKDDKNTKKDDKNAKKDDKNAKKNEKIKKVEEKNVKTKK